MTMGGAGVSAAKRSPPHAKSLPPTLTTLAPACDKKEADFGNPCKSASEAIGRTVSRFLFYPVIYLRNLPPGKGGQPF